ncbi:DUF6118 family protein [Sphingomonas sp. GC_Shp_3]|uniref:DUF6118 family protein n=1 Tax=Sphingomonas sp. GC_Shp_3 TaxID=2937383 RepID=UPI00226A86CD|nr:DUF6118 family protein [Sphingomonas sp. GC_Shp_3]
MDDGHDDRGEDGAARAFVDLTHEVSLLRAVIGGLTAAREAVDIPNYEPTLARTERLLGELVRRIDTMGSSPAMMLTPEEIGQRLNAAVTNAARELRHQIGATDTMLRNAAGSLSDRLESARRRDEQNRLLLWTGLAGLVLGMLLYAIVMGPIVRLAPSGWLWPERMAARIVAEPTPWDAGKRLMRSASPERWDALVAGNRIIAANRDALVGCRKTATKTNKPIRCTIEIGAAQ